MRDLTPFCGTVVSAQPRSVAGEKGDSPFDDDDDDDDDIDDTKIILAARKFSKN